MDNKYYSETYMPGIIKWGKLTMLLGIITMFLPPLVFSAVFGYWPPLSAILTGTLAQVSECGAFHVVEPISYFPILGIPGTYMTFLSGNTSNMRLPCSSVAQEAAGVEFGSRQGTIISTIGIGVSVIVNIVILTIGAVGSNVILGLLPEAVTSALNFLLPALFGAVFGQFAVSRPKLAVVSILIVFAINWLNNNGCLGVLGDFAGSVVILVSVFGSIFAGRFIYKKELADDGNEVK